ncbi:MAG: UDP-N-acetylglucosamine 1-carboxyvinyltransferase [Candidatus Pacebacteria bacterium GW2011_GWB1_47_8]|nr:MAG: UDP-N-acetylglucosamine 1-carboxyvinyltransferase [Candidatus Pacebacteria bacterium GW2011_GWA1_46_10]KKU84458.1 MAG: UDP-N-acetylglucosamine 1-carboxyvinyltransferase [Candidatus Pacebacteria bacterium GW2011_GWB1_47_8]HCR81111.1 UDP-N-acetylglucosamine 1-carboxyvinyltransferase [Candidatus Paceibacterota bacterium]
MNTSPTSFIITGGTPLQGKVRLSGAKNASYKLMIASLLGTTASTINNLPEISDVMMVAEIIRSLGGQTSTLDHGTQTINPQGLESFAIDEQYGEISRASTLFIAPLLARFGEARVPLPGGDKIGKRPLERHFEGLRKMGAVFGQEGNSLVVQAEKLVGTHYRFAKNTHTGTETMIMAAVLAKGKTVLANAAAEPEVDDLILFLNTMGARIVRTRARTIEIEGVASLEGANHTVMPDRNEAVSYACAALATRGDIVVTDARPTDLAAFLAKLTEIGAGFEITADGIRFFYQGPLQATDVETAIHPGFMTDWQPLWAVLMCHAQGQSTIHETVMQNRFQYIDVLRAMGATIKVVQPQLTAEPEQVYNFNWVDSHAADVHAIQITGPTQFRGGEFTAPDLRAGAIILIAAVSGTGQTILHNISQIERGYSQIDEKLTSLGARIQRVTA